VAGASGTGCSRLPREAWVRGLGGRLAWMTLNTSIMLRRASSCGRK